MNRVIHIICSLLFLGLLVLPTAQRSLRLFPEVTLSNISRRIVLPELQWKTYRSGKFARQVEDYLVKGSGLYGTFVRTHNSVNYLMAVAAPAYRGDVLIGRNRALFHAHSLEDLNGQSTHNGAQHDDLVRDLSHLAQMLEAQGIAFMVAISPNKALIHPEWVPWRFYSSKPGSRQIDTLRPKLEVAGIPHVVLSDVLGTPDHAGGARTPKRYARSGAHLNDYGACLVTRALSSALAQRYHRAIFSKFECTLQPGTMAPSVEDQDLGRLLNVFSYRASVDRQPKVRVAVVEAQQPRNILLIGSSNLFGVLQTLRQAHAVGQRDFFFYTKSRYSCGPKNAAGKHSCQKKKVNKKKDFSPALFAERDLVILEIPEARVHQVGFGKLKALLGK